jgi:threonine dehydratase
MHEGTAEARVHDAAKRFFEAIHEALPPTPLEFVPFAGGRVRVKREDLQETGSFKVRGALCRLALEDPRRYRRGVVCASAGNHGKGVAWAAARLGIMATVVVPKETPLKKRRGIEDLGAELVLNDARGYDAAEAAARELATRRDVPFLSPFDDPLIQAGNGGTIALEILRQAPDATRVVAPVGGGGLAAGLVSVFAFENPLVEVLGVQSEASPAMARSLADGRVYETWPPSDTLAEGLEGGVAASTVALCKGLSGVSLVSEKSIAAAMTRARRDAGIELEGSAATTLALVLEGRIDARDDVVFVLTGGNVDPERLDALEHAENAGR